MPAPSPGFKNSGVPVPEECTAPGVGTRQTFDDSLRCKQRWQKYCTVRGETLRGAGQLEIYSAVLHMNRPVTGRPAIQHGPGVKAFQLFQTVCRAGRDAQARGPGVGPQGRSRVREESPGGEPWGDGEGQRGAEPQNGAEGTRQAPLPPAPAFPLLPGDPEQQAQGVQRDPPPHSLRVLTPAPQPPSSAHFKKNNFVAATSPPPKGPAPGRWQQRHRPPR